VSWNIRWIQTKKK